MSTITVVVIAVITLVLGTAGGYVITTSIQKAQRNNAKTRIASMLEEAQTEAKNIKKEAELTAKEEALKIKTTAEQEAREKQNELNHFQQRLLQKEEILDKKEDMLDKSKENLEDSKRELEIKSKELASMQADVENIRLSITKELERVAGLSKDEAKKQLVSQTIDEARKEAGQIVREIENEAREEGEKKARNIITLAIQKCATDHTADVTVSTVTLPSEEMKGRIIGREGRNVRAIESATGVDLIIDDTPEAVIISCFDPIRREVARLTLEKLIADGRIHPARIEDIVEKVKKDIEKDIKEAGENATFDAGVFNLHPELVKLLGRLKFRTSYGQNCLKHSLETSYIAGLLAGELGVDVTLAKRAGLLHDIGKAVDFEMEGTHVSIGVDLARKYKESEAVIHCIEAHHGGVEYKSIEAVLVQVADAISSARPGARRESLDQYIKRLQKLEEIANSFKGVENSYAIQAGREVRIVVKPEEVNDPAMPLLAKEIVKKIESEMEYPGQIKVTIIRETRASDIAS